LGWWKIGVWGFALKVVAVMTVVVVLVVEMEKECPMAKRVHEGSFYW
jgi:hypothetical protein